MAKLEDIFSNEVKFVREEIIEIEIGEMEKKIEMDEDGAWWILVEMDMEITL